MATITGMKPQRRKEDRLNIYLDGAYAFSLHNSIANTLQIGQQLSEKDCAELQNLDAIRIAQEQAVHFLQYRPRSRSELENHLRGKGFTEQAIQAVASKFEELKWLDDKLFSQFWVAGREDFRPRSRRMLRMELRHKGIDNETIEDSLQEIDEAASAYRAAQERARRLANLDYQTFRRRLGGFLQRRGFSYETVKTTVERLWAERNSCSDAQAEGTSIGVPTPFGPSAKDKIQ
jgi:regulatory protein